MKSKRLGFFTLLVVLSLTTLVYAQERIIKLKDGAVLRGEVLSKESNIYKVSTASLGTVFLKDEDVVSIETEASQGAPQPAKSQMEAYQQKIVSDPNIMKSVKELSENQEIIDMLADPQIRSAIMRQDTQYLKTNEKFLKIADNPQLKKISEEVQASVGKKDQQN